MKSVGELECDCGGKTAFEFEKPRLGSRSHSKVVCRDCRSLWSIRFRLGLTPAGIDKPKLLGAMKLLVATSKYGEAVEKKKQRALEKMPQKKAPQFFQR